MTASEYSVIGQQNFDPSKDMQHRGDMFTVDYLGRDRLCGLHMLAAHAAVVSCPLKSPQLGL